MKKHILRALCVACVLTLCLPMAACDMEFGGLVGELLANKEPDGVVPPEEWASDVVIQDILPEIETAIGTGWDEVFTGDIATVPPTEDSTYEYDYDTESPTTEIYTTEPPVEVAPIPNSVVKLQIDMYEAKIRNNNVQHHVIHDSNVPGKRRIVIENCNVECIRMWAWIAFNTEQVGEIGYRIDDGEYVFDQAFLVKPEQTILDLLPLLGALSATRIDLRIPILDLSGEHVIEIVTRNAYGSLEILDTFTLEKTADPYTIAFLADAYNMAACVQKDMAFISFLDVLSTEIGLNGSYVTLVSGVQNGGDPWIFLGSDRLLSTGARYLVVKYRTSADNAPKGEFFVGSGSSITGVGDQARFEYINDGDWHLQIIDLSTVKAVNDYFDVRYLRYDFYTEGVHGLPIDVAYVAIFSTVEAALQYDAEHPTSMN